MRPITITAPQSDIQAGARVLRAVLVSGHPMVCRIVAEALNECRPSGAFRLADTLEAALLAEPKPVEASR